MHVVHVIGPRPDFRVFIGLLYGDMHNVDTEGDSVPVYSRHWRELYIKDRESADASVEIAARQHREVFEVRSADRRLEQLAALYLFQFCGDRIEADGTALASDATATLSARYSAELDRARQSIWHRSSKTAPYPNMIAEQAE
jgi:hypothetical protein